MLKTRIIGGQIMDGAGSEPLHADIGILGDQISAIGDLSQTEAHETISAEGLYVCPGFIDVHSHSDAYLLIEPSAPSKIRQGVTTEIVGQCGASAAPLMGEYKMPSDWRDQTYPDTWNTVAEYKALLEAQKPAANAVLLIGHNTIRAGVMGYGNRRASHENLNSMKDALRQALEEGGRGFTTGLLYLPGRYASPEEVWELAKIAAEHDGIYATHMRSEGAGLLEAIDEVLEVGRRTGVRIQISHLKISGRNNWSKIDAALGKIRAAQDEGLEVAADRYPYTAACTELDVIFPDWAAEGGPAKVLERLRDPRTREKIRGNLNSQRSDDYWPTVRVGSTVHRDNERFRGMSISEIGEELNLDPGATVLHLVERDELKTGGIFFGMNEDNMWRILAEPYVMIGSDASLRSTTGPLSKDHPHPRAYGTFPKLLRAAIDGKTVPLPEMIRKMTSLPAGHFRLEKRGLIKEGYKADITIFNPATVRDKATYDNPHQYAEGIEHVFVNGEERLTQSGKGAKEYEVRKRRGGLLGTGKNPSYS